MAKTQVLDTNSQLRLVIVGGDVILPEYVALWQQSPMSFVRLVNAYGPTETTITATLFEIPPQLSQDTNLKKIPIGRPLRNRNVYILDTQLQPVPIGVPGELYIGGAGLAKGYLNQSELTQEKFIPNPFEDSAALTSPRSRSVSQRASAGGSKLYKTGDLARYLPDSNIEYLGRIDNQVKIRGFRIELGEIEAVPSQYSHVRACCAIASEDAPGDKRLVVYIAAPSTGNTDNQRTTAIPEIKATRIYDAKCNSHLGRSTAYPQRQSRPPRPTCTGFTQRTNRQICSTAQPNRRNAGTNLGTSPKSRACGHS